ncbi:MAG TPA: GNAT family N-acetyltransferase [Burkholderiaceae bacterium]|nr:GNAT family N-acetyltransferase [Burkholderiaceae bacterium]
MQYELLEKNHAPAVRKYTQLPKLFRWFSAHCVLRSPEESDVLHVWNAASHPSYARCWTSAVPASLDEVTQRVTRALAQWQRGTHYALSVHRKATQEFVGWIELSAHPTQKGAWLMQWFLHPRYVADAMAHETLSAALDLMFGVLDAKAIYARCPADHLTFEKMLNQTGFIEVAPAGSLDATTHRPRSHGVFEICHADWSAMKREPAQQSTPHHAARPWAPSTQSIELALV